MKKQFADTLLYNYKQTDYYKRSHRDITNWRQSRYLVTIFTAATHNFFYRTDLDTSTL